MLTTNHWAYQYPHLDIHADFKTQFSDFQVTEILGYEPLGEGEHIYLWVEKRGLNTAYLAEQIAKFTGLPLRSVTYAGRKDKYALTTQWFGIHFPGKQDFDWDKCQIPDVKILKAIRHNKKLRTGNLSGNHFTITLRNLNSCKGLENRLTDIQKQGVPNYFGSQRFGDTRHDSRGGNLALAEKMLAGEAIRNRNKRSMAISALRSWLFNEYIHQRISSDKLLEVQNGDVMQLAGSKSFFCANEIDSDIKSRLTAQDIFTTAPLWGQGELASQLLAQRFEQDIASQFPTITTLLDSLGLQQERRALRLFPKQMQWQITGNTLVIQFSLPSGCFATSVLREILILKEADAS